MSYETFRLEFADRLSSIGIAQIPDILGVLDAVSSTYDVTRKTTDIIPADMIPEAVRLYIASKTVEHLSRGTLDLYYLRLTQFFTAVHKRIDQVDANDIRVYLFQYRKIHNIKDSTLEGIRLCLNSFFEWCSQEDLIRKNPVKRIPAIRVDSPERLPMTALELETVRGCCHTLREKAMVDFLYSSACRVSEFCALNLTDINWNDHTIHIERGKGGKGRTTFLNPEAEISLRAYLASRKDDCPALFVGCRAPHNRLAVKAVQNEIQKILSRCAISCHVTPHIFRHTAASLALQRGMPLEQVQRFLGHSRIQTTLRYAKTLQQDVHISHSHFVA
ncbi:MAG: tyrosine-type recombinase/integrase [Lachnospiraceae bacterium]|nr:tyrosine-type recombinase/integrase [Lachnospiraceae bacterium]